MSFDPQGNFIRPGGFRTDQANGAYFIAERADQELDAIALALTTLKATIPVAGPVFNPTIYYTKTQTDGLLGQKQDNLGFTPISNQEKGQAGGVVPLNNAGQIDPQYLPTVGGGGSPGSGVTAFNGRGGNVGLLPTDITAALGFTPAPDNHTQPISTVTGLQAALNSKQPNLGFVPANVNHTHGIGDINGLQAVVDATPQVYSGNNKNETVFPKGHVILVQLNSTTTSSGGGGEIGTSETITTYETVELNQLKTIRISPPVQTNSGGMFGSGNTGTARTVAYTTTPTGSVLTGQWRSRGSYGAICLFERVA